MELEPLLTSSRFLFIGSALHLVLKFNLFFA